MLTENLINQLVLKYVHTIKTNSITSIAGEFLAFITGANLIIDYVLSNAAVARSFTGYLCTTLGLPHVTKLRITISALPKGFNEIDFVAVAVVLALTVIICYRFSTTTFHFSLHFPRFNQYIISNKFSPSFLRSTRGSSLLNMVLTVLHILFIIFVIAMGFSKGDSRNLTHPADPKQPGGFSPFGATGVFSGAAMVYLSYIGYDAVSTMAEEVRNPVKDIPIGVSGSVILVTILYCLMAASMSMLLPYDRVINSLYSSLSYFLFLTRIL